jgi:peroxiredoxin (alkyl hydroperoxide reductase subunit C)
MKKIEVSFIFVMFSALTFSQNVTEIPLLGDKAPSFSGESTQGVIHFPKDFGDHWKLILSHPRDFTPVCTTELLELANMQEEFKKLNVDIIVISTDTLYSHQAWIKSMEGIKFRDREAVKIDFPLVDDNSKRISYKYGMLHKNINISKDVRGVFVVDPENTIRLVQFYPMEVGRNMNEIKRTIMALQTTATAQVCTPANWEPGDDVLIPYRVHETSTNPDVYQLTWYLTFKKQ